MKQLSSNTVLKFAVITSLFCHILMFNSIELTFGKAAGGGPEFIKIFFFGSILESRDYHSEIENSIRPKTLKAEAVKRNTVQGNCRVSRLGARSFANMIRVKSSPICDLDLLRQNQDFYKSALNESKEVLNPSSLLVNLTDHKATYFEPVPLLKTKNEDSSIMFYPPIPYHFLLYFKDRQTAHVEVAFYISPKGKFVGIKRKISSGNPEVDLLIMRNLNHFLNLNKSNLALDSWQTVKVDLSP